ncbi:mycothiol-dependent nitroreductase Rv2466c family protein [Mycobacteroides saopaulense]|uniref:DSBA-like thioredoxin domain-containing protein n=1 Tax=Mycobacteroides saopaulense TaxID=1578165 RepID=A0ABX3C241_9MYCO|nr:hypothetical protein [Mycobacteroides saopaulense]OHT84989.1 hypothetical protein BKG68_14175 [Mycobacteroides saopaulense]OHU11142.1 hypothetical protein BKG73_07215 [Mycobacteroides saopaulense]
MSTRGDTLDARIWLDPVCPFSWNTARWLDAVASRSGLSVDWQLMNLAVLNEGRELPPAQRARMDDSRRVGRLMAGIHRDLGQQGLYTAYFVFGELYFGESVAVGADLAERVLAKVAPLETSSESLADASLDPLVRSSHEAGQRALGDVGGSPLLQIAGRTFFGPVLTALPEEDSARELFDAVTVLARVPEFTQLQRPRPAH